MLTEKLLKCFDNSNNSASGWIDICDGIAEEFDGIGTAIFPTNKYLRPVKIIQSSRLDRVSEVYVKGEWYLHDIRERGLQKARLRGFTSDFDFITQKEMQNHPYYRDFLRPHGLGGFIAILFDVEGVEWVASIQFPSKKLAPDPELLQCVPHIKDALESKARKTIDDSKKLLEQILNTHSLLDIAVVLTDISGKICQANKQALSLLKRFQVADFVIKPKIAGADQLLKSLSIKPSFPNNIGSESVLANLGELELKADITYVPLNIQLLNSKVVYITTLRESVNKNLSASFHISNTYSLTTRELEVVRQIISGKKISEASKNLKISQGNIRQHLKRIFRKLNVSSQVEMVVKILN